MSFRRKEGVDIPGLTALGVAILLACTHKKSGPEEGVTTKRGLFTGRISTISARFSGIPGLSRISRLSTRISRNVRILLFSLFSPVILKVTKNRAKSAKLIFCHFFPYFWTISGSGVFSCPVEGRFWKDPFSKTALFPILDSPNPQI